jgi:uncharacterized membrane protein
MNNQTQPADLWKIALARASNAILLAALVTGSALRMALTLASDFPWNDGGMFHAMVGDLLANHFWLPAYTSFNAAKIPFVYPPLPFYLGGALSLLGGDLIQIQRWLPLAFSILTIPAFYLLSRAILEDRLETALATSVFAVILPAFDRLLMGGGLTRAPGLFFALLALLALQRLYRDGRRSSIAIAALGLALVTLSHPVYAWFTAYSALLLYLFSTNRRRNLYLSAWVLAGALLLTAPWWITVCVQHGLTPLRAAMQSREALSLGMALGQLLIFDLTREKFLDILGSLALLGVFWQLANRKYLLPAWLVTIFLLERTTPVSLAAIPMAMLSGVGTRQIVRLFQEKAAPTHRAQWGILAIFTTILIYSALSSGLSFSAPVLSASVRQAIQWAGEATPAESRFAILSGAEWWNDPASEWFPALSKRVNVTTVQGTEWLPAAALGRQIEDYDALQACLDTGDPDCIERWRQSHGHDFEYLFIVKPVSDAEQKAACGVMLQTALQNEEGYQLVYDNPGAAIFRRK